jgi:hypothetical protein
MMKRSSINGAILALSMAANLALGLALLRAPALEGEGLSVPSVAVADRSAFHDEQAGEGWEPLDDGGRGILDLAARLRGQNLPDAVVEKLVRGDLAIRWYEQRTRLAAAINAAIDSGDATEWARLEGEQAAWRKQMEWRLLREWGDVEGLVPWLTPEELMLPREWSPRKRWEVRWIEEEANRAKGMRGRVRSFDLMLPEGDEELSRKQSERETQLGMLMSPVDLLAYELSHGSHAGNTREELHHTTLSGDEIKIAIDELAVKIAIDELAEAYHHRGSLNRFAMDDEELRARRVARLGEERVALFEMETSSVFLHAADVTERLGLPREAAVAVYEIEQAKKLVMEGIDRGPEGLEARRSVWEASDELIREILGPEATREYQRHRGTHW